MGDRQGRGRAWRALVCALLALSATAAPAGAAPAKPKLSVANGAKSLTARFDAANRAGTARTATVTLLLALPAGESGRLAPTFYPTAPSATATDGIRLGTRPIDPPAGEPQLLVRAPAELDLAGGVNTVHLTFALAAKDPPSAADGLLELRLGESATDVLTLPVAGAAPKATVAPNPVKMQVTRWLGPLGLSTGTEQAVAVTGPGAAGLAATPAASAKLTDGDGRTTDAEISFDRGAGATRDGTVTVSGWPGRRGWLGTGAYTGSLQLDGSSATPTAVKVDLEIGDSLLVTVFFLGLGAALGWWLIPVGALGRRRKLLHHHLASAYERYAKAVEEAGPRPGIYTLDELLGATPTPKAKACPSDARDLAEYPALYCRVHSLEDDEFADATAEAQRLIARLDRWHAFRGAQIRLRQTLATVDPPADSAIRRDTEELLERIRSEPPESEAAKLLEALRLQRQILTAYDRLAKRYGELDEDERAARAELAPDVVYDVSRGDDPFDALVAWRVQYELDAALDELDRPRALAVQRMRAGGGGGMPNGLGIFASTPAALAPAPPAPPEPPAGLDDRDPGELLAAVKRWDLATALLTALVTLFVYAVTIHDGTWGGIVDYLSAFGAGFAGQAIAGLGTALAKLPALQSYRLGAPAPAAAKKDEQKG